MNTYLIYQNKRSINSIIDEPSGCMKELYNTLLPDLLKEGFGEQLIIQLMNEALCISTRILIDPNPELHLEEYFNQKKEEDLFLGVEYKRFLKVMVYRIIAYRHDYGTGRFQTFLNLLEGKIWWHYSMNVAALRKDTDHYYAKKVYLPIDFSRLRDFVEKLCANENKPDEQQSIRIYHLLTNNDTFYFKQMLSLLSASIQHMLIHRLFQIFTTSGGATRPLPHQDERYEQFVKQVSEYRKELLEGLDDNVPFVSSYFDQEMLLSLDGKRLADHDAPIQLYDPDKAMQLWEQLYGDFLRNEWPKEVDNVRRKLNRLPIEKHRIAMKQIMDKWEGQLYRSNFLMYYEEGDLDETFSAPDTGFHNEEIEYDSLLDDLTDLYDYEIGILNEEKMAHYVWCNAWRLTMQQLHAFLMHHQARLNFEPTGEIKHQPQQEETEQPDNQDNCTAAVARQTAATSAPTTTTAPEAAVPKKPQASAYVNTRLANNQEAWNKFVEIMQSVNPRINPKSGPRDNRWKWPHIKMAFEGMGFIDRQLSPTSFGMTIKELALGRSANSVVQSLKNMNLKPLTNADENIIADIKERFKPVTDILNNI